MFFETGLYMARTQMKLTKNNKSLKQGAPLLHKLFFSILFLFSVSCASEPYYKVTQQPSPVEIGTADYVVKLETNGKFNFENKEMDIDELDSVLRKLNQEKQIKYIYLDLQGRKVYMDEDPYKKLAQIGIRGYQIGFEVLYENLGLKILKVEKGQ